MKSENHYDPKEVAHFHRAMHKLKQGGLHRALGIPEDQTIPMERVEEATHSENPHLKKMALMAKAMHGWHHG